MTDAAPIPQAEFATALERLSRPELASFVGDLYAESIGVDTESEAAVEVSDDPPSVTIVRGDTRSTVLVGLSDSSDAAGDVANADAIVLQPGESLPTAFEADTAVVTPADLRERLLYALAPPEAEPLCEDALGVPARARSYVDESRAESTPSDQSTPTERSASVARSIDSERSTSTAPSTTSNRTPSPSTLAAVGSRRLAVIAVLLFVAIGAGAVAFAPPLVADEPTAVSGGDGVDVVTTPVMTAPPPPTDSETTSATRMAARSTAPARGDGATLSELERNVRPRPTCERSYLQVVQIQTNALKYNDEETNDGIRTVRRFASPRNRRAVTSFAEFTEVINSPAYASLLTYESAQYEPTRAASDRARVRVITRRGDNVTGRYEFQLRKIDSGQYDGCWMTDSVLTQPSN
ncbi:hypothetical protein DVK02_07285 [Halobellus sp. Atlit-31R]|nr:hypothetical protein DVK02_07285 [Halobellus sp. Atlit-31R]